MTAIVAGHESLAPEDPAASDLPDVEPSAADLAAIEGRLDDVVEARLESVLSQLAVYGHRDQVGEMRYRREVRALLAAVPAQRRGGEAA